MGFGTIQRTKRRVTVHRGFDPNNPTTRTRTAPIASGVVIKSGQVISLAFNADKSRYEWVLGFGGSSVGVPFIAYNDSADFDVIEAGNFVGLSSAGQFEISTPFFKTGDTYNEGVLLTYDGVTGDVKQPLHPRALSSSVASVAFVVPKTCMPLSLRPTARPKTQV